MPDALPSPIGRPHAASGTSRRGFLLGSTAAVVLAGAGGAAIGLVRARSHTVLPPSASATLLSAQHAELVLIADLDRSIAGRPADVTLLRQIRAEHTEHLAALTAAIALGTGHSTPVPTPPQGTARARGELAAAEQAAARSTSLLALTLTGADSALLASIAACEATHAEVLA